MKTISCKSDDADKEWFVVDAEDQILGRMASRIAMVLRGKHKATFTPHTDTGDFVIVVNAEKVKLTGNKLSDKMYYHHSGYPGGIKSISAEKLLKRYPERVIYHAVRGMLPKNILGRKLLKKLKVYGGAEHPHQAQKPQPLALGQNKG